METKHKATTAPVGGNAAECRFALSFYVFQEGEAYVAYCPSLDISTCAPSHNEAVAAFFEMFQLHVECCLANGTLEADLLAHGWKLRKGEVLPPTFSALMRKPEMKRLMNGGTCYERVVAPARIPAFA